MVPAKLPRRKSLRDSAIRDSVHGSGYGHYKLPKAELRIPEALISLLDSGLVFGILGSSARVAEQLFHDALLAHRLARQALAEFTRRPKVGVRKPANRSHG